MYIWLMVLAVLFGISVIFNIELWCLAKELKAELIDVKRSQEGNEDGTERSNYYFDNITE